MSVPGLESRQAIFDIPEALFEPVSVFVELLTRPQMLVGDHLGCPLDPLGHLVLQRREGGLELLQRIESPAGLGSPGVSVSAPRWGAKSALTVAEASHRD